MAEGRKKRDIVEHAYRAFYDCGFSLGVDAVMADTGISKRTLYKYFPSKEELVVELIDHYREEGVGRLVRAAEAASPDPRGRLRALFEVRRAVAAAGDHRGCFALDALVEFRAGHPKIEAAAHRTIDALRADVQRLAEATGHPDPVTLTSEALLLLQGAIVASAAARSPAPFDVAIGILDRLVPPVGERAPSGMTAP